MGSGVSYYQEVQALRACVFEEDLMPVLFYMWWALENIHDQEDLAEGYQAKKDSSTF